MGMLSGTRVISCESYGVVPCATGLMADMGATVIRVEPPGAGDGARGMQASAPKGGQPGGSYFDVWNRGKQCITLDVTKPAGKDVLLRLLEDADVFAHNLRPSALERYGLGYETLDERFPRLVYANFTAYGDKGVDRDRPGLGPVALWTRSGLAELYGDVDVMPEPTRGAMDDTIAAMALFGCIMAALVERANSGRGQKTNTSHYQVGTWINTHLHEHLAGYPIPRRLPHWSNPARAFYQCKDDQWVLVAGVNEGQWKGLLTALELEELIGDERCANVAARHANAEVLVPILRDRFRTRPAKEWSERIRKTGGVCDIASTLDDIVNDPQAIENGFFFERESEFGTHKLLSPPLNFSRTPLEPGLLAPKLGEHTDEVLSALGYSADQVASLRSAGTI